MVEFRVPKKSGFRILVNPIRILDFRKKLFYDNSLVNNPKTFNLPAGKYYLVKGSFVRLKNPVNYQLPSLPKRERMFYPNPYNFAVKFAKNPNKASIYWDKGVIVFDNAFKQKSLPELFFVLYHEYGHKLYTTEKFADLFAIREMLKKGFNPSQIGMVPITTLSGQQFPRMKFVVDNLTKKKK